MKRPAAAMTAFGPARIIDLAPASLGLSHDWSADKGAATWIEFNWAGQRIQLDCEVRTCRYSRADGKYRSGIVVRGGPSAAEFSERVKGEIVKMKAAKVERT